VNGRIAALIALVIAILAVVVLLGNGGDSYEVTAEFENAGQLVKGNEVVIGGTSAGSVKEIELGPEGQALVTFSVEDDFAPLRRGTVATIRSPSLSQIAGRQVQLTLPPSDSSGPEIEDGGTLTQSRRSRPSTSTSSLTPSIPTRSRTSSTSSRALSSPMRASARRQTAASST
jgi:ABC-type transporter Mla subunit MlaD